MEFFRTVMKCLETLLEEFRGALEQQLCILLKSYEINIPLIPLENYIVVEDIQKYDLPWVYIR